MSSRSRALTFAALVLAAGNLFFFVRPGEGSGRITSTEPPVPAPLDPARSAAAGRPSEGIAPLRDEPLEPYRRELLDFAFNAASAIPEMPHIKTRSRGQERVVVACFELDQPRLALRYVEEIDNWRRGAGYADVAFYLAEHGRGSDAQRYLDLADEFVQRMNLLDDEIAGEIDDGSIEGFQAWRRDRIRAKIARTYLVLGDAEKAGHGREGLEPSESLAVELVAARTMDASAAAAHGAVLDSVAGEANLERVRNALAVGVELLGRFYSDAGTRALLEGKLQACMAKSPVFLRIEFLLALAGSALEQDDETQALARVKEVEDVLGENLLAPEDGIPLLARLAGLRHRAGDEPAARRQLDAVRARFQAERAHIPDLERADVLVPVAETAHSMGNAVAALELYRQAVADGAENPNGVPRAEDLCATLCSMARHGVEPDAELWREIRAHYAGLHEPW